MFIPQAGAIAARVRSAGTEFLIVTAKSNPSDWIFPKGKIKKRESLEEAALRELREEAGVTGDLVGEVGVSTFRLNLADVQVTYFLVRATSDGYPCEGRQLRWLPQHEAAAQLSFADARPLLERAAAMLVQHLSGPSR